MDIYLLKNHVPVLPGKYIMYIIRHCKFISYKINFIKIHLYIISHKEKH